MIPPALLHEPSKGAAGERPLRDPLDPRRLRDRLRGVERVVAIESDDVEPDAEVLPFRPAQL
jgi:hypothetical protein